MAVQPVIAVEEFFAEPQFAVPMISPDGTRIAYLAPHRGRRNIWVRGVDQTHDDSDDTACRSGQAPLASIPQ